MNNQLRNQILERDSWECQKCGKKLRELIEYGNEVLNGLSEPINVQVLYWKQPCWKCKNITPITFYKLQLVDDVSLGDVNKIDKVFLQKYRFIQQVYSRALSSETIANVCVHCSALQGNFFVNKEFLERQVNNQDFQVKEEFSIKLNPEDIGYSETELTEMNELEDLQIAHVHHKDKNPQNNSLSNLITLCNSCHAKVHHELKKIEKNSPNL